jgi:MoxR-like ATPase
MIEFARYYVQFIRNLLANIWKFISNIFKAIADLLFNDIVTYFEDLALASEEFYFLDWLIAVIIIGINLVFFIFLLIRLYQFLRRYIRFVKSELEKDELLEEVALITQKNIELADEKNKILALKMGVSTTGYLDSGQQKIVDSKKIKDSRFIKLIQVDEAYKNQITTVSMEVEEMLGLSDLITQFINFSASRMKLYYDRKTIATYFSGMATSKIIILEGISGTGKTSLPYSMGKFFNNDAAIISVQPSWRDKTEIVGYLNEFTKKFNETDFLKELYEATYREDLNFIVLDEFNLARIEYYFAEFLSMLEMPDVNEWKIDIVPDKLPSDPKHLEEGKLLVPQNVWFVGTANKDDSTFTITDKVYDRAIPIVMDTKADYIDAPYTESINMSFDYLETLFNEAIKTNPVNPKTMDKLEKLDQFVSTKFKITFGNRILKQIKTFVPVFIACGGDEYEGLDYIVSHKILRKFESLNLPFLKEELQELLVLLDKLFGKNKFKESADYINSLLKQI